MYLSCLSEEGKHTYYNLPEQKDFPPISYTHTCGLVHTVSSKNSPLNTLKQGKS